MKIISLSKKIGRSLGQRSHAATLREEILQYPHPVQLDFEGVKVISYTFAEEFFGRLAEDYGTEIFQKRVHIKNLRPENRALLQNIIKKYTQDRAA